MNIFTPQGVYGDLIGLDRTHPNHLDSRIHPEKKAGTKDFASTLVKALEDTNQLVHNSTGLTASYITDPESVDAHDVTLAMAKANLGVQMTKAVMDGAIKAYREIINLR